MGDIDLYNIQTAKDVLILDTDTRWQHVLLEIDHNAYCHLPATSSFIGAH